MRKISKYFLNGLVFLVPVVATIYVVYAVFMKIDNLFNFPVPGMGFAITILMITVIGFVGSNFLTRKLVNVVDVIFSRLPIIKMIYTSVKDLIDAFVGDKKGFNKPVSVMVSQGSNIRVIGFVTKDSLDDLGLSDSVAVYLPQSYNFAGNLIIAPSDQVTPINTDSGDVMKFVVSGGISVK
jgi:uncharacterized membrane protein